MKANTVNTIKFKKLKMRLGLTQWQTVGLLESIWAITASSAPCGDIGKFSNEDICASIEWDGDYDAVIDALIATGWIDESDEFRLVIHDWSDHCPTYIKGNLAKHGRSFSSAKKPAKQPAKQSTMDGATKPSQAKPSQVKPEKIGSKSALAVRPGNVPEEIWNSFLAIRKAKRAPLTTTALDGIIREANKAGASLSDVLACCCERGWQSFKADWSHGLCSGSNESNSIYEELT